MNSWQAGLPVTAHMLLADRLKYILITGQCTSPLAGLQELGVAAGTHEGSWKQLLPSPKSQMMRLHGEVCSNSDIDIHV